ncbi:MAG: D-alanyl-D-alanine carboxypeptidase/D-alanyl-D-alanine endopeptidase [Actinomycetota bacterium]
MRTHRLVPLVVGLLALTTASPSIARVPEKTPKRHVEASIRRTLGSPAARSATPGILVTRGGRPAIAINADRAFLPASLLKLATTTTAMIRFGADHRFVTRLVGRIGTGGVTGPLTLVGGGDPTFATEAYRREHFLPKPDDPIPVPVFASGSPTVERFAAVIAAAGVRRIQGDLRVDDTLFDARRTQPGWIAAYQRNDPDIGNIGALSVNEGYSDVDGNVLYADPAVGAGRQLVAALAARGIVVTGKVRRGTALTGSRELARIASPPLAEIVDYTNRYSANYAAELTLKGLGARFGGAGTTAAGVQVVRDTLAGIKIPMTGFQMADGSGLSMDNRMTPRMLGAILQWILHADGKVGEVLRNSLPVAGGPGTIFKRMTKPPTGGNLRGKTGFIRRVRAMAGWVTAADGVPLVYVALFNDAPSPLALTTPLDLIGTAVALFGVP